MPLDKHTFSIVRAPPCLKPVLMPTHLETLQAPNIWDRGEKWGVMLLPQTVSMPSFSPVHIYPFKSIWNLWFPSLFPVERYQPLAATLYRNFSFPSLFCLLLQQFWAASVARVPACLLPCSLYFSVFPCNVSTIALDALGWNAEKNIYLPNVLSCWKLQLSDFTKIWLNKK